jgi:hypothetical protein
MKKSTLLPALCLAVCLGSGTAKAQVDSPYWTETTAFTNVVTNTFTDVWAVRRLNYIMLSFTQAVERTVCASLYREITPGSPQLLLHLYSATGTYTNLLHQIPSGLVLGLNDYVVVTNSVEEGGFYTQGGEK